jgi:hypothetical protein
MTVTIIIIPYNAHNIIIITYLTARTNISGQSPIDD